MEAGGGLSGLLERSASGEEVAGLQPFNIGGQLLSLSFMEDRKKQCVT